MDAKDWREVIELCWWDRHGPVNGRMDEQTHQEIEELARRIAKKHRAEMAELERDLT